IVFNFSGYTETLDRKSNIVVPEDDLGLYAIDILDPSLFTKCIHSTEVYHFHDMIACLLGVATRTTLLGYGYDFRQSNSFTASFEEDRQQFQCRDTKGQGILSSFEYLYSPLALFGKKKAAPPPPSKKAATAITPAKDELAKWYDFHDTWAILDARVKDAFDIKKIIQELHQTLLGIILRGGY
ncbi:hypothetical protein HN873_063704, partial [Arachis hypogaea]